MSVTISIDGVSDNFIQIEKEGLFEFLGILERYTDKQKLINDIKRIKGINGLKVVENTINFNVNRNVTFNNGNIEVIKGYVEITVTDEEIEKNIKKYKDNIEHFNSNSDFFNVGMYETLCNIAYRGYFEGIE